MVYQAALTTKCVDSGSTKNEVEMYSVAFEYLFRKWETTRHSYHSVGKYAWVMDPISPDPVSISAFSAFDLLPMGRDKKLNNI